MEKLSYVVFDDQGNAVAVAASDPCEAVCAARKEAIFGPRASLHYIEAGKTKETAYIVVWAQYNRNEGTDALCCGRLRETFVSMEEARREVKAQIICDVKEWVEENESDEAPEAVAESWIWSESADCIKAEHDNIEEIYSIESI